MQHDIDFEQTFAITGGDFINGGDASCKITNILKEIGIDPDIILRIAVAAYEAEMNVVMYAPEGFIRLSMTEDRIKLEVEDTGPGIKDIELAMKPGFSTATEKMREMGFGAGMGLPNIKKNADRFRILSRPKNGTRLTIIFKSA